MVSYYRLREIDAHLEGGAHIIPASDFSAIEEATDILDAAERRAAEIVEDARRIFDEEKLRGYEEGRLDAQLDAVARLLAEHDVLDAALSDVATDISSLVETCVRKIIRSFDDGARAEAVVREALAKMRREKRVELRAPRSLYGFFRATVDEILRDFPEVELIDVVEDPALAADQIVIESSLGRVDGNLGRQLDELKALLFESASRGESRETKSASIEDAAPDNDDA